MERIFEPRSKAMYGRDERKPRYIWNHLAPDEEAPVADFRRRSAIFLVKWRAFLRLSSYEWPFLFQFHTYGFLLPSCIRYTILHVGQDYRST